MLVLIATIVSIGPNQDYQRKILLMLMLDGLDNPVIGQKHNFLVLLPPVLVTIKIKSDNKEEKLSISKDNLNSKKH